MSNFDFLRAGWPEICEEARRAEHYVNGDPRSSLFYARRAIELTVKWLYKADSTLLLPYKDDLVALLYEVTFKKLVGQNIHLKMELIRKQGNGAVHRNVALKPADSLAMARELFHVLIWLATHYALTPEGRPAQGLTFDNDQIAKPRPAPTAVAVPAPPAKTQAQIAQLDAQIASRDKVLADAAAQNVALKDEITALRLEIAVAKAANASVPDTHDYKENETRDLYIDKELRAAGWALDQKRDLEFAVSGMPAPAKDGKGFVDYVLWGNDGLPLGLVEAKRTHKDAKVGQHQAKLYADALEQQFGQRPVIFYSNGYEHYVWDDTRYPPRQVQGFYTRDQLALLIQRRTTRKPLASLTVNAEIAGRHYQQRAIRKIGESFENNERKALLVMATGSGKTRTVIGLTELLTEAHWVKNILFLADRKALVRQAAKEFLKHRPETAPVNLVEEKNRESRVYLSTYPTMMGLINSGEDELRRFGPGYFDLIIIDEAHRSVYQKYGAIFDYFDALLVGITATPKDEVDHNTYGLFELEDGVPTDAYDLNDAISEGYLVPPVGRSIATKFLREGIKYSELSAAEQERWDELEWVDDEIPSEVESHDVNSWLFNTDTVDKVLETLMAEGRRVAGGDRLGKTIIFARNNLHATFIAERFDKNYPHYAGHFASIITHKISHSQSLIDAFTEPDKAPHIAISVDMLDTGIDVPDVVNLVFFKPIFSKTKFWQMVGRGTRLRPDLYGPGKNKEDFVIFDVCQNLEYFNEDLPSAETAAAASLTQRLFEARLALLAGIDTTAGDSELTALREGVAARLHGVVTGMTLDNFLVRPHRRAVERFAEGSRWLAMTGDEYLLARELAGLPSADDVLDADEKAKRFDLQALRAQLGVLVGDPGFAAAKRLLQALATALGNERSIPAIAINLPLIDAVAGEEWWQGVTVAMLETMRIRLRGLIHLIDGTARTIVYSDFEDTVGESLTVQLQAVAVGVDRLRFREKATAFLRIHQDDAVLFKLRHGRQLTPLDLAELQRILVETGGFVATDIVSAALEAEGLGLFVRSVLGLDRVAATEELSSFTAGTTFTGNQLAFVNLLVEQLTQRGTVDLDLLYKDPFTGVAPTGPETLFTGAQVTALIATLRHIKATAQAS